MDEIVFNNFFEGSKKAYLDKKQVEADEKKRKEDEELENKRLKEENDRLKKEADDAKKIADDLEKEKQEKADLIIKNQLENERLKNEQAYKDFLEKNK
jgi:translation initiation factor 4G